jgi:hypothetical protein
MHTCSSDADKVAFFYPQRNPCSAKTQDGPSNGSYGANCEVTTTVRLWPILLKNSFSRATRKIPGS